MLDSFTTEEIQKLSKNLSQGQCGVVNECMNQFKQLLELNAELYKYKNAIYHVYRAEIQDIGNQSYEIISEEQKLFQALQMCHLGQRVKEDDTQRLSLYYPHETTYQYITGYRQNNPNNYEGFVKPERKVVKQIIDESIRVGVDPFGVLGMAMMERAGGELYRYYENMHDKRSQMVLGCDAGKFAPNGMPQLAKRSDKFNEFAEKLSIDKNDKDYFVCVGRVNDKKFIDDTKGFSTYNSLQSAKDRGKTCCVKTKFDTYYNENGRKITSLMYFDQIQNKNHHNPMAKNYQKSIEHRLNTFLGMSYTVGTFPSYRISPYRVGVNSFEDPNYGRQIMDYMLNTFMRNGDIMSYIREAEKKYKTKRKSLLCFNRKAGSYMIDSDYYFDKIKNTKRLSPIKRMYDSGKAWNQIGIKYQSVMIQEFSYYRKKIDKESAVFKKFKNYLSKDELITLRQATDQLYEYRNASVRRGKDYPPPTKEQNKILDKAYKIYFSKPEFYEHRKVLVNAAREDTGLSWDKASMDTIKKIKMYTKNQ